MRVHAVPLLARACVILALCCSGAIDARAEDTKLVLIIHSNESVLPATVIVDENIRKGMRSDAPYRLEFFSEFMDAARFPRPEQEARIEVFLREKYAPLPIDLVITTGPQALDFLMRRRASLFPQAPVLFSGVSDDAPVLQNLPSGVSGVVSRLDPVQTLELALRLQPDARQVVVVSGAADFDRKWDTTARSKFRPYEGRLTFSYLSGLPMAALLRELGRLTPDTIVIYLTIIRDGAGENFLPRDVARMLSDAAGAPVYGLYDTYLDHGIVGGYMDTFAAIGTETARLARQVLAGAVPETFPPHEAETHAYRVDWRQLQRWGLSESRLPPGSIVLFKRVSLWDQYKGQVAGALGLIVLQSLLIIALWIQMRRRRRAEDLVTASEERMSLAAVSANIGLWRWDVATGDVWVTEHCQKLLGLRPRETLEGFLLAVHPDDRPGVRRAIETAISTDEPFETEYRLALPDGSTRWLSARGSAVRDASGGSTRLMGVIVDISQRKQAELESDLQRQELTHLTRVGVLGELSGALAHELGQPLATIFSNAQAAQRFLAQEPVDLREIREILDDILAEDKRASEVIRRLRAMLKKGQAQLQPLDLNDVTTEVLDLARADLVGRSVGVTTQLAPDLPAVRGDRIQLQQVLLNLIFNACEAMSDNDPAERQLAIVTAPNGLGTAQISVIDRGNGIPANMLERLFEPFVTTKAQGLGLGLSISRSIVTAHGGRLWAANNPDRGASFFVALPAVGSEPS
jgi:PAS domain S-box-containing protein